MHLRRLWFVLGFVVAITAHAAVIYKWTDANGVVHYSDHAVPGAEPISVSTGNTSGVTPGVRQPPAPADRTATSAPVNVVFAISSPVSEQVFFGDDSVPARVNMDPPLASTQVLSWTLNGAPLTEQGPNAVSFSLPRLARGTYTLTATLTDGGSGESRSASVTFYVRQPSELSPQHR